MWQGWGSASGRDRGQLCWDQDSDSELRTSTGSADTSPHLCSPWSVWSPPCTPHPAALPRGQAPRASFWPALEAGPGSFWGASAENLVCVVYCLSLAVTAPLADSQGTEKHLGVLKPWPPAPCASSQPPEFARHGFLMAKEGPVGRHPCPSRWPSFPTLHARR